MTVLKSNYEMGAKRSSMKKKPTKYKKRYLEKDSIENNVQIECHSFIWCLFGKSIYYLKIVL